MTSSAPTRPSIYQYLITHLDAEIPIVPLTKATLVHLSHTLEDLVLKNQLPALIFTGFQESSHWAKETRRYRQLAEVAQQVCIFAGKPLSEDEAASAIQIELASGDPLRQEWFVAILSSEFTVVLCGLDRRIAVEQESFRQFDTIWTFEPDIANQVLDLLENVIQEYRPELLAQLQKARQEFPPVRPKTSMISMLTSEMLRFEDKLNSELSAKSHALAISESLYRSVVTNAPVVLITLNEQGIVTLVEGPRTDGLGHTTRSMLGESVFDLYEHVPDITKNFRLVLEGEAVSETIWFSFDQVYEMRCTPLNNLTDQRIRAVCVLVDVTERERAREAEREQASMRIQFEKERELSALRRQLMIMLSHELRTPLASIRAAADLLDRYATRLDENQRRERIVNIQRQTTYLNRVLEDIDLIIESETRFVQLSPRVLDLNALCADLIQQIRDYRQNEVRYHPQTELEAVVIDERLFRAIVSNLLSNAVKYSDDAVDLEVSVEDRAVLIIVRDRGIGIPLDEQERIFDPFHRADNVGSVEGTGLGMAILKNSVDAYGGRFSLESKPGIGTTVTVHLPIL